MTTRLSNTSDLWWKNAVIYCVDIETYFDSDGDGVGDIAGITQRIDYLAELGITCLWLMPFYPTPDRDDGYDVTDLFGVDSRLGHHGDLVELIRTANDRGIRVIADLVVNHTPTSTRGSRRPAAARTTPTATTTSGAPTRRPDTSAKVVFPTRRTASGSSTRRPASGTSTTSTSTSPTSTSPTRRCATRSPSRSGSGSRWASPASASTPCRSSSPTSTRPVTTCRATRTSTSRRCGRSSADAAATASCSAR